MIDISEILKDCPKGTKLYSPVCGECRFIEIVDTSRYTLISCMDKNECIVDFDEYGRFDSNDDGECLLFPSKENRDWNAFNNTKRFKKGDFINNRDFICIYNGINEHGAIEFVAFIPWNWDRNTSTERYDVHPTEKPKIGVGYIDNETRLATEDEKNLLLSAIEYEGYEWDSEKLELRKKEPEFKQFDNVLVRNTNNDLWKLAQYGFKQGTDGVYNTVGGAWWSYCIPYEGNEHLLGTDKNCK